MTDMLATPVAPEPPPTHPDRLTFEAFVAWAMKEAVRAEWVDGEVVVMSPSSFQHQRVLLFLYDLVNRFVRARRLGEVFVAPILMRLITRPSGREPDLLFVATANLDRIRETYLDGPADLAVEIVSPESDARDRGDKFIEYETGGVPEYWLIDPLRQEAYFYQRGEDERYHAMPLEADGTYRSAVLPGFWLRVGWLWQRPLPPVGEILTQLEA